MHIKRATNIQQEFFNEIGRKQASIQFILNSRIRNKQTNNNKGRFLKNLTLAILNMKLAGFAVNSVVAVPSNNISYENNETLKDGN